MTDDEMRFYNKVAIGDGCWEWQAHRTPKGYGTFRLDGRSIGAHRASWHLANGAIPDGLHVLHRCDNPACVRPGHLFLGTNQDNVDDRDSKGRLARGASHRAVMMAVKADPAARARGERHGVAVLNEAKVRDIRESAARGATQREIARRLDVSRRTVGRVISRELWGHVEGSVLKEHEVEEQPALPAEGHAA